MTDQALVDRLRTMLAPRAIQEQRMFGGICFMLSGNMLAAASKRGLLVRIGKDAYAAALAEAHVRPMDMRGKPMEGYVYVDPAGTDADSDLRRWLDLALAYVGTLPPKQRKPARNASVTLRSPVGGHTALCYSRTSPPTRRSVSQRA